MFHIILLKKKRKKKEREFTQFEIIFNNFKLILKAKEK